MKLVAFVICSLLIQFFTVSHALAVSDSDFLKSQKQPTEKMTYIFYMASWCAYCEKVTPAVQDMYRKIQSCPILFLAVSGDDSEPAFKKLKAQWPSDILMIRDEKRLWLEHFRVRQIPRSILIGEDGNRQFDAHGISSTHEALARLKSWAQSKKCFVNK